MIKTIAIAVAALLMSGTAFAQTTYTNPTFGGGWTTTNPSTGTTTYTNPTFGGGYVTNNPRTGTTTYSNPTFGGGYIHNTIPGTRR
jgi:hypothetical protein